MATSTIKSFQQALYRGQITTVPSSVNDIMSYQEGHYRVAIGVTQNVFPSRYGILEIIKANAYGLARFTVVSSGLTEAIVFERSWNISNNTWYESDWLRASNEPIISDSNYCKMPDGTLIQWGVFSSAVSVAGNGGRGEDTIDFQMNFANASYTVTLTDSTSVSVQRKSAVKTRRVGSMDVYFENAFSSAWNPTVYWIAIGRWK